MNFLNVVPFLPDDVDFMVEEAIRVKNATGLDVVAISMTLHPEGDVALEKPLYYTAAFAELQRKLAKSSIKVGILLQTLIGHGWSSASQCQEPFQLAVNIDGDHSGRFCPLDQGFLDYVRKTIVMLAKEKPAYFLLDDDTRLINNAKLECFCPLHRAKFKKNYSEAELRRLIADAPPGDDILNEFEAVRRQSLEDFCRAVRAAIDSVDPAIPCGICGSGREHLMFERMALALTNDQTEPFIRVGNALYMEGDPKDFTRRLYHTALQVKACGKVKELLDEADTYPQHLYSKSAVSMHAHITGGILHNLTGGKLWIASFSNPKTSRNDSYEAIIRDYTPFYTKLKELVADIRWQGSATPLVDLERHYHPLPYPEYFTWPEWQSDILNRFGIPGIYASSPAEADVWMMAGNMVDYYTDDEMKAFCAKGLLLDSIAAWKLAQRGFTPLMGVDAQQKPLPVNGETNLTTGESLSFNKDEYSRLLQVVDPSVKIFSELYRLPYVKAPTRDVVAPGSTGFVNSLGGRVVVTSGALESGFTNTVSPFRKTLLIQFLNFLHGKELPFYSLNQQDIYLRYGSLPDRSTLAAIVNLNFDTLKNLTFHTDTPPKEVWQLSSQGAFIPVNWHCQKTTLTINAPLPIYQPMILKIKF